MNTTKHFILALVIIILSAMLFGGCGILLALNYADALLIFGAVVGAVVCGCAVCIAIYDFNLGKDS